MKRTDLEEFTEFARARWDQLVRAALFYGCGPSDAEDLAPTVLLKVYKSWRRVSNAADPDAYVFRMLSNALRDVGRRKSGGELPVAQFPNEIDESDDISTFESADFVQYALAKLPDEQRQVVVLRVMVGLSERQAAEVLDVPAGTVKSRLHRGLSNLRHELRPLGT